MSTPPVKIDIKLGGKVVKLRNLVDSNSGVMNKVLHQMSRIYGAFIRKRFSQYSKGAGDWPALALSTIRNRRDFRKRAARVKDLKAKMDAHDASWTGIKTGKGLVAYDKKKKGLQSQLAKAVSTRNKNRSSLGRDTKNKGRLVSAGGTVSILQDTGKLFSQLSPEILVLSSTTKTGGKFKAQVTYGGTAAYPNGKATVTDVMSFHQEGGGKVPRRKILVNPDPKTQGQMEKSGKRIITEYLNGK